MSEFLLSIPVLFSSQAAQLLAMFASSFLSATLLPANSEIVFVTLGTPLLISQKTVWSLDVILFVSVATIGNTLGGMTTYWIGRFLPSSAVTEQSPRAAQWALDKIRRFGAVLLLLSWVPVIGDMLCGVAGWLRLNARPVFGFMLIGKAVRYILLIASIQAFLPSF